MSASKYEPLRRHLLSSGREELTLSLEEIEEILGFELPHSAETPNWWSNTRSLASRAQRRAWADARYDAFFHARSVTFKLRRLG